MLQSLLLMQNYIYLCTLLFREQEVPLVPTAPSLDNHPHIEAELSARLDEPPSYDNVT